MSIIDKSIRSGDGSVDSYIEWLEESLISFEASNIKRLIISADSVAGKLADDLDNVINSGSSLISFDKDDKTMDRVMNVITKVKDFISISESATLLRPKNKKEDCIEEELKTTTKNLNAFEMAISKRK